MSNHEESPEYVESASHVYHHQDTPKPSVNVNIERNSRGLNWSVTVVGASGVKEAMALLLEARNELEHNFGTSGG